MSGIAKEVKDETLGKVKSGEKVMAISKQYGVSEKTVYNWLRMGTEDKVSLLNTTSLSVKTRN